MDKRYAVWAALFALLALGILCTANTRRAVGEGLHDVVHVVPFFLVDSAGAALDTTGSGTVKVYRSQGDSTGTTIWLDYGGTAGRWNGRGITYGQLYTAWYANDSHDYVIYDSLFVAAPQLGDSVITRSANFAADVIPEYALRDSIIANAHFDPDTTYDIALGVGAAVPDTAVAASIMRTSQVATYMEGGTLDAEFLDLTVTDSLYLAEDVILVIEGATDDAHETTVTVTDPTADRTITLPNSTGTVALTSGTVDNALASGYIIVGNAGGVATDMAMSQDATIDNTGKLTIQDQAIEVSDLNDTGDAIASGELVRAAGAETFDGQRYIVGTLALNQTCQDTVFHVSGVAAGDIVVCSWDGQPQWSDLTLDIGYTVGMEVHATDSLRCYTEPSSNGAHTFMLAGPVGVNYILFDATP